MGGAWGAVGGRLVEGGKWGGRKELHKRAKPFFLFPPPPSCQRGEEDQWTALVNGAGGVCSPLLL